MFINCLTFSVDILTSSKHGRTLLLSHVPKVISQYNEKLNESERK